MRPPHAPVTAAALALALLAAGCTSEASNGVEADAGVDSVADAGPESDAETDSAAEVDPDSAADSEPEPDPEPDSEADSDPDADAAPDPDVGFPELPPLDTGGPDLPTDVGPTKGAIAPGDLVITEIMVNPAVVSDLFGEWIEVANVSGEALDLAACALTSEPGEVFPLAEVADPLPMPPGALWVWGAEASAVLNGGVLVHIAYSEIKLSNGDDAVSIVCDGVVIDRVAWTEGGWPLDSGAAMSLSAEAPQTASANDEAVWWCGASAGYGEGKNKGTPGAPNPACAAPEPTITGCQVLAPPATGLIAIEDAPWQAFATLRIPGVTDLTPFVDPVPGLQVEAGYGPKGTHPAGPSPWTWIPALPSPGFEDAGGWDAYEANPPGPAPGLYGVVFRVALEGQAGWTWCDTSGLADGFSPAQAGTLESVANPCASAPCTQPPVDYCVDSTALLHPAVGVCTPLDPFTFECAYEPTPLDCAQTLETCAAGACEGGPIPPAPGDMVFTELMIAPLQWIELTNTTTGPLDLTGCALRDDGDDYYPFATDPFWVLPGEAIVFAADATTQFNQLPKTPAESYGTAVQMVYGEDQLVLECEGVEIDRLAWTGAFLYAAGFVGAGQSVQLGQQYVAAAANDAATWWCTSKDAFGSNQFGTPAAENDPCPLPPSVDLCRTQGPAEVATTAGATVAVYGRVFEPEVTDLNPGVDVNATLVGELGVGPAGASPLLEPDAWSWTKATPNWVWSDASTADIGWDEYVTYIEAPGVGVYDYAYRFSADGGWTWELCDLGGNADGYDPADAGHMEIGIPRQCLPDPCVEPPAATCAGDILQVPSTPAACSVSDGGEVQCDYPVVEQDCGETGQLCLVDPASGADCAGPAEYPLPSDLWVSEVMADPLASFDLFGQWFELKNINKNGKLIALDGCVLSDSSGDLHIMDAPDLVIAPGDQVVLGGSLDPAANGGAAIDYAYATSTFSLEPEADQILLSCEGSPVTSLSWNAGFLGQTDPPMGAPGVAFQRDPIQAGTWCPAASPYNDLDRGTPGAANPPCAE